ncbi:MAG: DUF3299 domain-containing protein [Pirellulales bacterium]
MSLELEPSFVEEPADSIDYSEYRALSAAAVISSSLALLSSLALVDWVFGLIPILGIAAGLLALKRIRENPAEYAGERLALAGVLISAAFLLGGWTRLSYVYATEVPEGYQRINYELLQPDPDDPAQAVPERVRQLNGQKVFIKGYMFPPVTGQTKQITRFMLVRDKGDCCFGGSPKMTDMILVRLNDPLELDFNSRIKKLAGTFRVASGLAVDGLGGVTYQLDADHAE